MGEATFGADLPSHDVRAVLRITAFRKLWTALSLSSLGDWLGLLAQTALATAIAGNSYSGQAFAVAGVFTLRLLPAVLFGPIAGVVADRLDRRWTMVVCDVARFSLFVSIPLAHSLPWLFAATFLIEVASLFWIPAKEATVPNLVPRERLETANQLSLLTAYGTAPVAALVFTLLALISRAFFSTNQVDLALYFDAATFGFSALTIYRLDAIPSRVARRAGTRPSALRTLADGWKYVTGTPAIRGLVIGMVGAFAAGGAVVGLAKQYVFDLHAGNAAYGVLFGTVFLGLAVGMFTGPRLLAGFSRRRLFGLAICAAGVFLALLAVIPNLPIGVICVLFVGALAGVAWVTGYTMLGLEVGDELRGRTFAFVQTLMRMTLVLVLAVAPAIAGAIGGNRVQLPGGSAVTYSGAEFTLLGAGLLAMVVGFVSYRMMDDQPGTSLWSTLLSVLRNRHPVAAAVKGSPPVRGFFVAVEGGDGAGKSTQIERIAEWAREKGHDVVVTREPGGTEFGQKLRTLLLDPDVVSEAEGIDPRTEAMLYAADRAQHVAKVIRPALDRGAIVITDRYIDSSVAYQGAGRSLEAEEVLRLSRWATDGLMPNLTVLLDVDPVVGRVRRQHPDDRMEAEPGTFHERVREAFKSQAMRDPERYIVLDAEQPADTLFEKITTRLAAEMPLSAKELEERAEVERKRAAEEAEKQALIARLKAEAEEREAERRAEEERLAEERRREEEAEAARLAEQRRIDEEKRRVDDEKRRAEEEKLRAEEAEKRRVAEAEAAKLAAERRQAEIEAERAAAARRAVDERRLQDQAEKQRLEMEEAARKAEYEAALQAKENAESFAKQRAEAKARTDAAIAEALRERAQHETEAIPAVSRPESATEQTAELTLTDELFGPWSTEEPTQDSKRRRR